MQWIYGPGLIALRLVGRLLKERGDLIIMSDTSSIIGLVGGIIGILGGGAAFYDRFYKGRPTASLTTGNSFNGTQVLVRIKNTTSYDVVIQGSTERRGVYYLAEKSDTSEIIRGQRGKALHFVLKPDESKELLILPKFEGGMAVETRVRGYIAFWISWRRGNATWTPQIPVPVCTTVQTIRQLAGVKE